MRHIAAIALTIAAMAAPGLSQAQTQAEPGILRDCDPDPCFGIDWDSPDLGELTEEQAFTVADNGLTSLHYAAAQGSAEQVAVLLDLEVDPDRLDDDENAPLHYALLYNEDPQVVIELLRAGARPNTLSAEGVNPAFLALERPDGSLLMEELLDYGGSLYALDLDRRTLLHRAIALDHPEAVAVLLDLGLSPRLEDAHGETAIELFLESDIGEPARGRLTAMIEEAEEQLRRAAEKLEAEREEHERWLRQREATLKQRQAQK